MTLTRPASTQRHPNDWSDGETELLRDLAQQNLSARTIAASFPGKTRNAILGKTFRLGLRLSSTDRGDRHRGFWSVGDHFERLKALYFSPLGYANVEIAQAFGIGMGTLRRGLEKMREATGQVRIKPDPARRRPRSAAERARNRIRAAAAVPAITALKPEAEPLAKAVTIMGLTAQTCRWPVEGCGHDMKYCGCVPIPGIVYCGPHARRAFAR